MSSNSHFLTFFCANCTPWILSRDFLHMRAITKLVKNTQVAYKSNAHIRDNFLEVFWGKVWKHQRISRSCKRLGFWWWHRLLENGMKQRQNNVRENISYQSHKWLHCACEEAMLSGPQYDQSALGYWRNKK